VCLTALGIAAVSFAAPAITVVGLKSIAVDLGGERSVPALAYSLAWLGAFVGGIAMGQAAERFGAGRISAPSAAPFHRRRRAHARRAVPPRLGSSA
jgi:hypothetical protein